MESDVLFLLNSVDNKLFVYDYDDEPLNNIVDLVNIYSPINLFMYKICDQESFINFGKLIENKRSYISSDTTSLRFIFSLTESKKDVDFTIFNDTEEGTRLLKICTKTFKHIKKTIDKKVVSDVEFDEFIIFLIHFVKYYQDLEDIYFQILMDKDKHALFIQEIMLIFKMIPDSFFTRYNLYFSFINDSEQVNMKINGYFQCSMVDDDDFDHEFDIDNILDGSCPCCFHEKLSVSCNF